MLRSYLGSVSQPYFVNAEAIYVHSEFFTTVVITHPQRRTCERTCSVCLTVPAIKNYAHIFHTDTIAVVH